MPHARWPRLLAITDLTRIAAEETLRRARALSALATPGGLAVLLRDHGASARERLALGRELRALTLAAGQELWVADRLDLALALGADGLHLGEGSVPAAEARQLLGADYRISRAWHPGAAAGPPRSAAELAFELRDADALVLSPVLAARKSRPALGVEALPAVGERLQQVGLTPRVYALGGVTSSSAAQCLAAGAWGVAAIGSVWSDDAAALATALGLLR